MEDNSPIGRPVSYGIVVGFVGVAPTNHIPIGMYLKLRVAERSVTQFRTQRYLPNSVDRFVGNNNND